MAENSIECSQHRLADLTLVLQESLITHRDNNTPFCVCYGVCLELCCNKSLDLYIHISCT